MDTDDRKVARLNAITERVIGAAFKVGSTLGPGFLEKVYENALAHELRRLGLHVEQQKQIDVRYDGIVVGEFVCDLLVEHQILVEIKAIRSLDNAHLAQSLNYIVCTGLDLCLLLNFAARVEVRRVISPRAPRFPPLHLGGSGSSGAAPAPMTHSDTAGDSGRDP